MDKNQTKWEKLAAKIASKKKFQIFIVHVHEHVIYCELTQDFMLTVEHLDFTITFKRLLHIDIVCHFGIF